MNIQPPKYVCTTCDNVSVTRDDCHGKPMSELCYCGSGKPLEECHGAVREEQSHTQQ